MSPMTPVPLADLTPVAHFDEGYFLENLAPRADGSVLITAVLQKELWCVPPVVDDVDGAGGLVDPVLVHRFDHPVTGLVEIDADIFIINLTEAYTTHESHLLRLDLTHWEPGDTVQPETVFTFDDRARGLNGSCLLAPGSIAIADCFAGLIWRVDLHDGGRSAEAEVWLSHPTMAWDPDSQVAPPPQPGVNGVHYDPASGYLYYTSTAQKVFMRVPVDPDALNPSGPPEFVAAIDNTDDFCLDESAGFAYVTRHRASTVDRVPLEPGRGSEVRHIAGEPYDPVLAGPSAMTWGREPGQVGRVAYVTTDGGRTSLPPDGVIRKPALLRLELSSEIPPLGGRLELFDPGTLDAGQRPLFSSITDHVLPWAGAAGFAANISGRRLIGPFNAALLRPEVSGPFLAFQAAEGEHTSLDERVRQTVILSVGAVWQAEYELYAHARAARHSGLSDEVISELVAGESPTEGLRDAERIAHDVARTLTVTRRIPDDLYQTAHRTFGAVGVFDIIMLVGAYQTVCGILNSFAIPAPPH